MRLLFAILLCPAMLACNPSPPPGMTDPGQLIYLGYVDKNVQCSRCHGPEGQGGMFGPSLQESMRKLGADSVRQVIRFGRGVGENRMEGVGGKLSLLQIEQVMAFITTWPDSATEGAASNGPK